MIVYKLFRVVIYYINPIIWFVISNVILSIRSYERSYTGVLIWEVKVRNDVFYYF